MIINLLGITGLCLDLFGFLILISSHFPKLFVLLLHTDDLQRFLSKPEVKLIKQPKIRVNEISRITSDDISKTQLKVTAGLWFVFSGIVCQLISAIFKVLIN